MATIGEIVREIGKSFGHLNLSTAQVEKIVLQHTGYPCFYPAVAGETNEERFKAQVKRYFEERKDIT
jgi:hypothetical protein